MNYLLENVERGLKNGKIQWWAKGNRGYTTDRAKAKVFNEAELEEIFKTSQAKYKKHNIDELSKNKTLNLNDIKCVKNREMTDADVEGMAASIGNTMLLNPIILHEYEPGKLEVVAGRTRYHALMKLERYELEPENYRIINSDDAELISFVENFERRQLSILEEAEQIGSLLKRHDVMEIATILGRSEKYIRFRVNINKLIKPFKKALTNDEYLNLKAGHYEAISRFPESVQKQLHKDYIHLIHNAASVKSFTEKLNEEFCHNLRMAPFDEISCLRCKKRSLIQPCLFEELKDNDSDRCLDPECWDKKVLAYIKKQIGIIEKGSASVHLVINTFYVADELPTTKALRIGAFEMLECPVKITDANAFIVAGEQRGMFCRIRVNDQTAPEPQKPMTAEDKQLREQGRRTKKSILSLYEKIIESEFKRPDDNKLMSLAGRLFVESENVSQLKEEQDPEDLKDKIWKSITGRIQSQLHCHVHAPLNKIDAAYGEAACEVLGLSWDEFNNEEE